MWWWCTDRARLLAKRPRCLQGNMLQPGGRAIMAPIAQFLSGIPETVPLSTVHRQCSSGLQAVDNTARWSPSMGGTLNPGNTASRVQENKKATDCPIPMGTARAQSRGRFHAEIVPVTTTIYNDTKRSITVSQDEGMGIRPNTTREGLAKLKPAFKEGGSTTAGNSSQVSDRAASILLARKSKAEELGLPILEVLRFYAVVGVPPDIMGIGPVYAIPAALEKAGLTVNDVDILDQ